MSWRNASIAPDGTHHLVDGVPLYDARFDEVLKFHEPGLAPVRDASGAYHVDATGTPAYASRHRRTFGFYEGIAAVDGDDGWRHVHPGGADAYETRFAWCGNFQGGRCTVRDSGGRYAHIDGTGRIVGERWRYAGDYRDGVAVVQSALGLHTHVDVDGKLLHGRWFDDLDVFHKGHARARDEGGWMHVDERGAPLYARRFAGVEPFYNGQARVERDDGGLDVIDESGATVTELRLARRDQFGELSSDMVGFWRTETIALAADLGLIDALPADASTVSARCGVTVAGALRLLHALGDLGLVQVAGHQWWPTAKGAFLRDDHPLSLRSAATHWRAEYRRRWDGLGDVLRGSATQSDYFAELSGSPQRVVEYQRAIRSYARHDYAALGSAIDPGHHTLIDAGGGTGALLDLALTAHPTTQGVVLDRPEVVAHRAGSGDDRVRAVAADLFEPWPVGGDAVVLARVLHDWDDRDAARILARAHAALLPEGRLYIVEMHRPEVGHHGGLLDLHMLAATGGKERTEREFRALVEAAGFAAIEVRRLPTLPRVLVCKPAIAWQVPPSVLVWLERVPADRPVAMLVRHSVRPPLPPGDAGYMLPITEEGRILAERLGRHLAGRVQRMRSSPLLRCVQTAEAMRGGAGFDGSVTPDPGLGDPGVYVIDGKVAWQHWVARGHEGVMAHLVGGDGALPGMADPVVAARMLVEQMLVDERAGLHVHVTHDSLVTATAARAIGVKLTKDDWPWYLEAAFFWRENGAIAAGYRDFEVRP
jgi:broad specificity phosphatase PhoE